MNSGVLWLALVISGVLWLALVISGDLWWALVGPAGLLALLLALVPVACYHDLLVGLVVVVGKPRRAPSCHRPCVHARLCFALLVQCQWSSGTEPSQKQPAR